MYVIKDREIQWLQAMGYQRVEQIGEGAFSRVYRMEKANSHELVACKVSVELQMLHREGEILRCLQHPLFAEYYDFKKYEGIGFLFMEYVAGRTLRTVVRNQGRLCEREAIRIGVELAEGLCYLHGQRSPILFRDIKPENIMLQKDNRVRLVDFGSADIVGTKTAVITGTPGYAAPEQWKELEKVDTYSDVYAWGKVMQYMLNGENRGGQSAGKTDTKLHLGIRSLIEACTRERIEERVPNMWVVLHRLHPYMSGKRREIYLSELREVFRYREDNYTYQQNILRI